MPAWSAVIISGAVLPTPEKTIRSRRDSCGERFCQFAAGNNVGARAQSRERLQDGEIAVGLDRKGDEAGSRKRIGEDAVVPFERRRRIDIDGRADLVGQISEIDVLREKPPVAIRKMIHRAMGFGGCDGSFWPFPLAATRGVVDDVDGADGALSASSALPQSPRSPPFLLAALRLHERLLVPQAEITARGEHQNDPQLHFKLLPPEPDLLAHALGRRAAEA